MKRDTRHGVLIEFDSKTFSIKTEIKYVDNYLHVRCSYLKEFLPLSDFRYRFNHKKQVYYVQQPSRTGCRVKEWDEGRYKPRIVRDVNFEGVMYRWCSEVNLFLPIKYFLKYEKNGKIYYRGRSKYGKYLENQRYKSSTRKAIRRWKNNNPDKVFSSWAKRRAMKKNACPKWLSKELLEEINHFYRKRLELSINTGVSHHVHHIYPLHGTNDKGEHISCGLHAPWNLAVIPASLNMKIGALNPEYHNFDIKSQFCSC